MKLRLLVLTFFLNLLAGCAAIEEDPTLTWSVQQLYSEARSALDRGSFTESRDLYGKLLARYPYGAYAQQTNLDLILLDYRDLEFEDAIAQADKFLQLYPNSPYADYARYMKGVISYSHDVSLIDRLVPTNIAQSDQSYMKAAFEEFDKLVAQGGDSDYAEDAKYRMLFLRNIIAEHEIYVAEYYLRRGAYLAAANRGKYVLENYSKTPAVALALAVMVRSYEELQYNELANDSRRVLETNFKEQMTTDSRLTFILTGDVNQKKGFFASLQQKLAN